MKLKSRNSGLLSISDITPAMKVIVTGEAYDTPSKVAGGSAFRNVKVQLPNGTEKLASILGMSDDAIFDAWGEETAEWIGRAFEVVVRTSKAGNPYYVLIPTNEPRDMAIVEREIGKPLTEEEKATLQMAREKEQKGRDEGKETLNAADVGF